jgi:hypothetical protein
MTTPPPSLCDDGNTGTNRREIRNHHTNLSLIQGRWMRVYPVIFIDAIVLKVRDEQVGNKPIYVVIGVTVNCRFHLAAYRALPGPVGSSPRRNPGGHELGQTFCHSLFDRRIRLAPLLGELFEPHLASASVAAV